MRTTASSIPNFATVTGGAANTKGAWSELIASTTREASLLQVSCYNTQVAATNTSMLLEIAIGAAGSEIVLIPEFQVGYLVANARSATTWLFPITVPQGVRLSARCQGAIASDVVRVAVDLYGESELFGGGPTCGRCITMGANLTNSQGVTLTAGTANVKGTWTTIGTTTPINLNVLGLSIAAAGNTNTVSPNCLLDVGIGNTGNAVDSTLISNFPYGFDANETFQTGWPMVQSFGVNIPSGTRVAARIASSVASQVSDLVLIGLG